MKAKTFDRKFDAAEKVIDQLDLTKARRIGTDPKRVTVVWASRPKEGVICTEEPSDICR